MKQKEGQSFVTHIKVEVISNDEDEEEATSKSTFTYRR